MTSKTINIYIGTTDEQKGRRIAALEAIAKEAGFDSISAWLIAQADAAQGEPKVKMTIADFTKPADEGQFGMDFQRGYEAYRAERGRVGFQQARENLIVLVSQHIVNVLGGDPRLADNARQIELICNPFFLTVGDKRPFSPREVDQAIDRVKF